MNLQVILRHEVLRRLPKLIVVTLAVVTMVLGIITYRHTNSGDGELLQGLTGTMVQLFVLLSACMILFLPEAGRRCRPLELTFPVPGRVWWRGHFLSLLLAGLALMLVYAIVPLFVLLMDKAFNFSDVFFFMEESSILASWGRFLWRLWGPPLLFFILILDILSLWWPASAMPGKNPGWLKRLVLLVVLAAVAMALTSQMGLTLLVLPVLVVMALLQWRLKVPEALTVPSDAGAGTVDTSWTPTCDKAPSRSLVHKTIMRVLFKWPANWLLLLPMTFFFGIIMGGFNPITDSPDSLRFAHVFISAYILVSASGHFTEKMHLVDHLPVGRKTMLAWLVWPSLVVMVIGYGVGQWQQKRQIEGADVFSFVHEERGYGLRVPPRVFEVVRGPDAPMITAPWGESHESQTAVIWKGLPWLLYKPYSTPEDASLEFVAWQLQRAIKAVYEEDLPYQEILNAGIFFEKDGRVEVGDEGLKLLGRHPQWRPRSSGPVFPWLMGSIFLIYLGSLGLYFRLLRRQVSQVRQRVFFWTMMVVLLALHLGTMGLFMAGITDDWIVSGLIQGSIQRWADGWSYPTPLAYLILMVAVMGSWRLALRQFRKMEPPCG